ncbi:hypothetical protein ACFY3U_25860 [Micromonospora sp. NPDC000089]|uniref:hypothetical protein n=1 Tax=unclassified Micromonospora TaxID=2617518 RepID=UPI0036CD4B02
MTSPAEPGSPDATRVRQLTRPLRELAALVLLGANALLLFVGFVRLLVPSDYGTFSGRAGSEFFSFVGVESTVLPLLAVLLATHVDPVLPRAKQITQAAVGEYAFGALFGVLTFLIWLVGRLAEAEVLDGLLGMLTRVAWFGVFAVAAFVVYRVWRTYYHVPRPKPQPGVYGQPQPGWPQQPGPGGYGVPGQYGPPAPAGPFGAAPHSAPPHGGPQQPPHGPGQQSPYAGPQQPFHGAGQLSPFGGPQQPPYGAAPHGGAPAGGPGQPASPFGGTNTAPPFGQPPSADPTQTIPRQPGEAGPSAGTDDPARTQRRDDPNSPR